MLADADERHSMFGKTPMDWSQLDREPGKSRHALVRRLAEIRRTHSALTSVNGVDGLTWLDTTAPDSVSAFVRRGKGETDNSIQSYIVVEGLDRNVRGTIASEPLLARKATRTGVRRYKLGPYGFAIVNVGL